MKLSLTSAVLIFLGFESSNAFGIQQYLNLGFNYDGAGGSGFVAYYDTRTAGMGDKVGACYNCNLCHNGTSPAAGNINAYATAWRAAWVALEPGRVEAQNPDASAVQAWQNIESQDSDGDTYSNITEITDGSNPGDPTSTPSNTGCSTSGILAPTGGGGAALYNPNALNASCSKASIKDVSAKEDPKRVAQSLLFMMLPLLTLLGLKARTRQSARS